MALIKSGRPSGEQGPAVAASIEKVLEGDKKRVNFDVSAAEHARIKIKATAEGLSIKDWVMRVIRAELSK